MREKNPDRGAEEAASEQGNGQQTACTLSVQARASGDTISTQLQLAGMPESNRQGEGMALNVIARTMAFLYEGALIGAGREDTPEGRAMFFAGMQPSLMHMFLGITSSPQFQQSVAANRETARKNAQAPQGSGENG